jgi:hypothetical protein
LRLPDFTVPASRMTSPPVVERRGRRKETTTMSDRQLATSIAMGKVVLGGFRLLRDPGALLIRPSQSIDPYPFYEQIRARGKVVPSPIPGWTA